MCFLFECHFFNPRLGNNLILPMYMWSRPLMTLNWAPFSSSPPPPPPSAIFLSGYPAPERRFCKSFPFLRLSLHLGSTFGFVQTNVPDFPPSIRCPEATLLLSWVLFRFSESFRANYLGSDRILRSTSIIHCMSQLIPASLRRSAPCHYHVLIDCGIFVQVS